MAKVIEVTACQTCPYRGEFNTCLHPAAPYHNDHLKPLPEEGIADFCCLQDKDDYVENEFDIDRDFDKKPEQENIPAIERMYNSDEWVEAQRNEIGTPDEYDEHGNEIKQPAKGKRWKTMPPPFHYNNVAEDEGWCIVYTGINDDTHNLYELQTNKIGEFETNYDAKLGVVERAIYDHKGIHAVALLWLARYCVDEIDDIRLYIGDELWAKLKQVMRGTEFDKLNFLPNNF